MRIKWEGFATTKPWVDIVSTVWLGRRCYVKRYREDGGDLTPED